MAQKQPLQQQATASEEGQPCRRQYCAARSMLQPSTSTAMAVDCHKNITYILPQCNKHIACV